MRGSARDVASSLTRLNTTNQTEPPCILSYMGGNWETPVLSLCVSPLPSLARVGGCAVWSAARSSAIVGVLQAHRGLSDIIGNYCASHIGRASADDLHHSAARPMGLAMARRARLMRCSAEPARVRRWRGFQHLCSSNLGHVDPSAPPRDVALPRIPLIVRLSRALACNVVMRPARTVQQVDQGERPEVQLIPPIFSSDWGGRIKYSWASYLPELPVRAIGVAGTDVAYRRWRPVARGSRAARGVANTKVTGAVSLARARNGPESPPMPARPLAVRDARSARRRRARRSPREAGAERERGGRLAVATDPIGS